MNQAQRELQRWGHATANAVYRLPESEGGKAFGRGYESRAYKRRGRARVRYLTSTGRIIPGRKLFTLPKSETCHAVELHHAHGVPGGYSVNQLRGMTRRHRRVFFNESKAWAPTGTLGEKKL